MISTPVPRASWFPPNLNRIPCAGGTGSRRTGPVQPPSGPDAYVRGAAEARGRNEEAQSFLRDLEAARANLTDMLGSLESIRRLMETRKITRADFRRHHTAFHTAFRAYQDTHRPAFTDLIRRASELGGDQNVHTTWRNRIHQEYQLFLGAFAAANLQQTFMQTVLQSHPDDDSSVIRLVHQYYSPRTGTREHLRQVIRDLIQDAQKLNEAVLAWGCDESRRASVNPYLRYYRATHAQLQSGIDRLQGNFRGEAPSALRELEAAQDMIRDLFLDALPLLIGSREGGREAPPALREAFDRLVARDAGLSGDPNPARLLAAARGLDSGLRAVREVRDSAGWGLITEGKAHLALLIEKSADHPEEAQRLRSHESEIFTEFVPKLLLPFLRGRKEKRQAQNRETLERFIDRFIHYLNDFSSKLDQRRIGEVGPTQNKKKPSESVIQDPGLPEMPIDILIARIPEYRDAISRTLVWIETGQGGSVAMALGQVLEDLEQGLKTLLVPDPTRQRLMDLYDAVFWLREKASLIDNDFSGSPVHPAIPPAIRLEMVGLVSESLYGLSRREQGLLERTERALIEEAERRSPTIEADAEERSVPPGWTAKDDRRVLAMTHERLIMTAGLAESLLRLIDLGMLGSYHVQYQMVFETTSDFLRRAREAMADEGLRRTIGEVTERLSELSKCLEVRTGENGPSVLPARKERARELLRSLLSTDEASLNGLIGQVSQASQEAGRTGPRGAQRIPVLVKITLIEAALRSKVLRKLDDPQLGRGAFDGVASEIQEALGQIRGEPVEPIRGLALLTFRNRVASLVRTLREFDRRAGSRPILQHQKEGLRRQIEKLLAAPFDEARRRTLIGYLQHYYRGGGEERPRKNYGDRLGDLAGLLDLLPSWIENWLDGGGARLILAEFRRLLALNRQILSRVDTRVVSHRSHLHDLDTFLSLLCDDLDLIAGLLPDDAAGAMPAFLSVVVGELAPKIRRFYARDAATGQMTGVLAQLKLHLGSLPIA